LPGSKRQKVKIMATRTNLKRKKKYSFDDRLNYHKSRFKNFTDKFKYTNSYGQSDWDFDKRNAALEKNKSIQYSRGFMNSAHGLSFDVCKTESERAGYKAGEKALAKAKSLKY